MQAAPPVRVRGAPGGAWQWLCLGLPLLALGVTAAWAFGQQELQGWQLMAAAAALGGSLWAVRWQLSRRSLTAQDLQLGWDGQRWTFGVDTAAVEPDVMVDLDGWMLLRLQPAVGGAAAWLAIGAGDAGAAWHDLRVALHARRHQREAAPDDAADGLRLGI